MSASTSGSSRPGKATGRSGQRPGRLGDIAGDGRLPRSNLRSNTGLARRVVAVTGACHFLGAELIKRLEEDDRYERILALDVRRPDLPLEKTEFHPIDLTVPAIDRSLAQLFGDHRVDTVIHTAFLSHPTHATEWAHELEDVGTMHLLDACAVARPRQVIMTSTTMVYGASSRNPNYLDEGHELAGAADSQFITDKVRAEKQAQRFAVEHPDIPVCVLRFAPILGPSVENLFTRFFARPMAPVLMGHDPLIQLCHEGDAARALETATALGPRGPYNIVGDGVLPYTTLLAMLGRVPVPMPHALARPLSRLLWFTQLADAPPGFLDFLRYLCVADGTRARRELGFVPIYPIQRTVRDFLGVGTDDGAPDPDHVPGG